MASADHWDWNSLQISKDVKERRNRERELEIERMGIKMDLTNFEIAGIKLESFVRETMPSA